MIVHKFGGTSVGDAERIESVARIIASSAQGEPTAVVVSAMKGTTNRLIHGARSAAAGETGATAETCSWIRAIHDEASQALLSGTERREVRDRIATQIEQLERFLESISVLGELTARGHDAVVGYGERLSSLLLAAVLCARGVKAEAVFATDLIVTDAAFGAARPEMPETCARIQERITPWVEQGVVPVITGYIGATRDGVPTTLGRSGSDFSAAIVAACLNAGELRIWTDVDGILTADPNVVPSACALRELGYDEAAQLARFGAEVLHPHTVGPVIENGIPLRIVNSFNPDDPGTRIVASPGSERALWPAIVSSEDLRLLQVGGGGDDWRIDAGISALTALSSAGIDVLMFSQSFSEQGINLVVRSADADHAARLLAKDEATVATEATEVATISVIAFEKNGGSSVARRAFTALGDHGVPVLAVARAASDESLSICVAGDRVADTVRFLHERLGPQS